MRARVQPYNQHSESARDLARALGVLRTRLVRTRFRPRYEDIIINWGSTQRLFNDGLYLNAPHNVAIAVDKLASLICMHAAGVSVPDFTKARHEAQQWLDDGHTVVVRALLRANSGRGIVLVEPGGEVPLAPLYTKYVKKFDEYRVHVMDGQVIDIQQKLRRRGDDRPDSRVRNAARGWVFCRGGVECPRVVAEQGVAAVAALGLDFGGADVGFTRRSATATVYEVNTAPGLRGPTTLAAYRSAFRRVIDIAAAGLGD